MPLVAPHGGKGLKPLALTGAALAAEIARARTLPQVRISSRERGDLVMMGIGGFTPLDGFMSRADWEGVCQDYRTASGLFWPIPITLSSQTSFPVGKADSIAASNTRERAEALFMAHGVHLTAERTGVLIYVATLDRRVEIVADENIDCKVQQREWDELARNMVAAAGEGRLADGLAIAVGRTGELLALYFPVGVRNPNELPNRVVEI